MDNFGNIIFIGSIILFVIINIGKAMKKTQPVQQTPVSQDVEYNYFPSEIKQSIPSVPKKKKKQPAAAIVPEKPVEKEEEFLPAEENEYHLSDHQEARKALIFAEILNRKY